MTRLLREKYHVTPTEFIDVKALMGDFRPISFPVLRGSAKKYGYEPLIEKHHSIEYIYENNAA